MGRPADPLQDPGPEYGPLDIRAAGDLSRCDGDAVDAEHRAGKGKLNADRCVAGLADFFCGDRDSRATARNGHSYVDSELRAVGTLEHGACHKRRSVFPADEKGSSRRRRSFLQNAPPCAMSGQFVIVALIGPGLFENPL